MKPEEFVKLVKQCKTSSILTGYGNKMKVVRISPTEIKLFNENICKCCNRTLNESGVIVVFEKPQKLTIFEAEMLYMVLVQKLLPRDYCKYDQCIAGIEFIMNFKAWELVC